MPLQLFSAFSMARSIARWETLFDHPATLCPDLGMIAPIPRARVRRDGDPSSDGGTRHLIRRDIESAHPLDVPGSLDWADAPMLGWPVRTFEAAVPPGRLGWGWAKFAFGSWTTLSWLDATVWRRVVPKGWFYNVMVTGVKPGDASS